MRALAAAVDVCPQPDLRSNMRDGGASAHLDVARVRAFLAQCGDLDEIRKLRDQAQAVERYAKLRGDADGLAVEAAAVARRAERRMGELLAEMPKASGARGLGRPKKGDDHRESPKSDCPTLADLGVTPKDSMRWQSLAAVPEDRFESCIAEHVEARKPITQAALMRLVHGDKAPAEPEPFHVLEAIGELKESLNRVLQKTASEWPRESHPHIARVVRDLADEFEAGLE